MTARILLLTGILLISLSCAACAHIYTPVKLELDALDVPNVGKIGTVRVAATTERALTNVTITVSIPEGGEVVGEASHAVDELLPGEKIRFKADIKFSSAGYKFVRAKIESADRPDMFLCSPAYLLLDINTTASSVVTDSSLIRTPPQQIGKVEGLTQKLPAYRPETGGISPNGFAPPQPSPILPAAAEWVTVKGRWLFSDRDNINQSMKYTMVQLRQPAVMGMGWDTVLATTYTDWDGYYEFPAVKIDMNSNIYVRCYALSSHDGNGVTCRPNYLEPELYSTDTYEYTITSGGTKNLDVHVLNHNNPHHKAWWIIDDMTKAYMVPPTATGGHSVVWNPESGSFTANYRRGDRIRLDSGDADTPYVVLHEMGHSVMYNIYGNYLPTSHCPSPHYVFGSSHENCAFTEGWAHFWALWTLNTHFPSGLGDMETPTWNDGRDEGETVEGRVAGALWDLIDTNNDGLDTHSYPVTYIWNIMTSQKIANMQQFWNAWKSKGYDKHGAVRCLYQNTIDYNTAPVINPLPNCTIQENVKSFAFSLGNYASDAESAIHQLSFSAEVVPSNKIEVTFSQGDVYLKSVPNWFGTAIVSITCSDGIASAKKSFSVQVTPSNQTPTISGLPDIHVNENGQNLYALNLSQYAYDRETPSTSLTYAIVRNSNPQCGASIVSSYWVRVAPNAGWYGSSDLTIRVTDPQGHWSECPLKIIIDYVNQPPQISVPPISLYEDTMLDPLLDLRQYASDRETPNSSLAFQVISTTLPEGSAKVTSGRYLNITPPEDYFGSATVTIRVYDWDGGYATQAVPVQVLGVNDPPVMEAIPDQIYMTDFFATTRSIDLYEYASDVDHSQSQLTFTVEENTNSFVGVSILNNRYLRMNFPNMFQGTTHIKVRVQDPLLAYDEASLDVVVGLRIGKFSSPFSLNDGVYVVSTENIVTGHHYYPKAFYMQDEERLTGIRVNYSGELPPIGQRVMIGGIMTRHQGERAIDCLSLQLGELGDEPRPLYMNHSSLGGVPKTQKASPVPSDKTSGVYNVGLLVKTTGKVVSRFGKDFYIADGSGVKYSFSNPGLQIDAGMASSVYLMPKGVHVAVTGISGGGLLPNDDTRNVLRLRSRQDVQGLGGKVALIYKNDPNIQALASAMGERKWEATTIKVNSLGSYDLTAYDAIVICNDTSNVWAAPQLSQQVINSQKPVIAIGLGGCQFLDTVPGVSLGASKSSAITGMYGHLNFNHPAIWFDNPVNMQYGNMVQVTKQTTNVLGIYNDWPFSEGLFSLNESSSYLTICRDGRYLQWGYQTSYSMLTDDGMNLLVNYLYYMQQY